MSFNDHFQSKIQLLNNYALCLERENLSKTKEISTLHNHLETLTRQNDSLRNIISELKCQLNQKALRDTICESQVMREPLEIDPIITLDQEIQTDTNTKQIENMKTQINRLKDILSERNRKIQTFQSQCEEMYEGIQKLEQNLREEQEQHKKTKEMIKKQEERLRHEERRKIAAEKRLEEINQTILSSEGQKQYAQQAICQLEQENSKLISQNNKLIEQTRKLEKENNEFYRELKKLSRVSFGTDLSNSSLKRNGSKVKNSRWKEIQQNLQRLQQQNEAIKSNLMIF